MVAEAIKTEIRKVYAIAVLGVTIFVVPFNMLVQNWDDHDRSGNYVPWDYSYNLLLSCEKDAILQLKHEEPYGAKYLLGNSLAFPQPLSAIKNATGAS